MHDYDVGTKIRRLRLARKYTLQAVARAIGLSPALISQIENHKVSPPIATLSKIASFFDVKIGFFFEDGEIEPRFEVVRANERRPAYLDNIGNVSCSALSHKKISKKMEPFILSGSKNEIEASPHSHQGEEFVYVLRGNADLLLEEDIVELCEDDSVYFDANIRHHLFVKADSEVLLLKSVAV